MEIFHVVPRNTIFVEVISRRAALNGHKVYIASGLEESFKDSLISFFHLHKLCKKNPENLFIFHYVTHFKIFILKIFIPKFKYGLVYWGGDYYNTFLNEEKFQRHCLKKSSLLSENNYPRFNSFAYISFAKFIHRLKSAIKFYIGIKILEKCYGLYSMTRKQYRIIRYFYFLYKKKPLSCKYLPTQGYINMPDNPITGSNKIDDSNNNQLRVLISHSAAASVAHMQSIYILEEYAKKWNINICVTAFISYSGGSANDRDDLSKRLVTKNKDISIKSITTFLSHDELKQEINQIDIAVFSCLRDEGIGMLTELVKANGLLAFNRFSFNYDFFKTHIPKKTISHEEFLNMEPKVIKNMKKDKSYWQNYLLDYKDIHIS